MGTGATKEPAVERAIAATEIAAATETAPAAPQDTGVRVTKAEASPS